jgi:beta-galactosidase GanA
VLGDADIVWLLRKRSAGFQDRPSLPAALEVVRRERQGGAGGVTFYLNHSDQGISVPIKGPATDLLTTRSVQGTLTLEPFGVAILDR